MTEIIKIDHLPPMTAAEFATYMAAQQTWINARQAFYATAEKIGASAFARGVPYEDCPTDNTDKMFVDAWQSGWSDACGEIDIHGNRIAEA